MIEGRRADAELYAIFERDIKTSGLRFEQNPVWHDRRILPGERHEEGFLHLTTRDEDVYDKKQRRYVKQRLWDPRRSERLPWCKPTIENSRDAAVQVWDFKEANDSIRTYVWLKALDYVIILERQEKRQGTIFVLITAFFVSHDAKRHDLESRYGRRIG